MKKLALGIIGISGKMGKTLYSIISHDPHLIFIGGVRQNNLENTIEKSIFSLAERADVIIDFSSSISLENILKACLKYNKPIVIGTTGYTEKQKLLIKEFSKKIPIMYNSNFSIGIAICKNIIKQATIFAKNIFEIDISETHHLQKKDAPSGTALSISDNIKEIVKKEIPINSYRIKKEVGTHKVSFYNDEEEFEITHKAKKRISFAKGAIYSAKYIHNKKPSLYSFEEIFL